MKRAAIESADATFVLAGYHDGDVVEADQRHTFRIWSIKDLAPHVPLYSYCLKAPTTLQLKDVTKVNISNQLLKMTLLGCNTLHRLAIPFICNLYRQTSPFQDVMHQWVDQYGDGSGNEIYEKSEVNPKLVGKKFSEAAAEYYVKSQVILFAVMTSHNGKENIMLNPGNYELKPNDRWY